MVMVPIDSRKRYPRREQMRQVTSRGRDLQRGGVQRLHQRLRPRGRMAQGLGPAGDDAGERATGESCGLLQRRSLSVVCCFSFRSV